MKGSRVGLSHQRVLLDWRVKRSSYSLQSRISFLKHSGSSSRHGLFLLLLLRNDGSSLSRSAQRRKGWLFLKILLAYASIWSALVSSRSSPCPQSLHKRGRTLYRSQSERTCCSRNSLQLSAVLTRSHWAKNQYSWLLVAHRKWMWLDYRDCSLAPAAGTTGVQCWWKVASSSSLVFTLYGPCEGLVCR